jgi:hypothetical protein
MCASGRRRCSADGGTVCGCCRCRCPPATPNPTCFLPTCSPWAGTSSAGAPMTSSSPPAARSRRARACPPRCMLRTCSPTLPPRARPRGSSFYNRRGGRHAGAGSTVSSTPRRKLRAPPVTLWCVVRDGRWQTSRRRSQLLSPTSCSWSSAALSCR